MAFARSKSCPSAGRGAARSTAAATTRAAPGQAVFTTHAQTRFSRHTPVLQGRRVRRRGPFSLLSHVGRRAACGAWGGATCPFDALFRAAQQRLSRTPARQFCRGAADVVVSHTICCSGHHEMTHSRACRCLHNQARTATVAADEAWRWAHRRGQRECLITWMASQEHGCTQNSKKNPTVSTLSS